MGANAQHRRALRRNMRVWASVNASLPERIRQHTAVRTAVRTYKVGRGTARGTHFTAKHAWRLRGPLGPVYGTAGTAAAVAGMHGSADGWHLLLVLWVVAGFVLWRKNVKAAKNAREWSARFSWYVAGLWFATLPWAIASAHSGLMAKPLPGIGALLAIGGTVPYYLRRGGETEAETPQDDAPVDGDELDPLRAAIITTWDDYVACTGGRLPNSELTGIDVNTETGNWSAEIMLDRGKQIVSTAVAATEYIASAFPGVTAADVAIERTRRGDEGRAKITVYSANPLLKPQIYPDIESLTALFDDRAGTAPVGCYHDGSTVLYRWWQPGSGAVHALICGSTGSGKSRLLDLLLAYERSNPLICSWVIDPQNGQSLPDWQDDVDWFADTHERATAMLQAAWREMHRRNKLLGKARRFDSRKRLRRGHKAFTPTLDMPLLSITIDEAHKILADRVLGAIIEDLLKMGRKAGIAVRLVTQVPLLDQMGNRQAVRDGVVAGQVFILRTANRMTSVAALPGKELPADPSTLPRTLYDHDGTEYSTAGLGYASGVGDRLHLMRTMFLPDDEDVLRDPELFPVDLLYDATKAGALTTIYGRNSDEVVTRRILAAVGGAYTNWREERDREDDEELSDEDLWAELDDLTEDAAPPLDADGQPVAAAGKAKDRILDALIELGEATTGTIAAKAQTALSTTSQALGRYVTDGTDRIINGHVVVVEKTATGAWAAYTTGAAANADAQDQPLTDENTDENTEHEGDAETDVQATHDAA